MSNGPGISRRRAVKWGLFSAAGLSLCPEAFASPAQVGGRDDNELYEGKKLPGGGQLDPRFLVSPYVDDVDLLEVADRMSPFNPDSWHNEWKRAAEKNEQLAEEFEKEGLSVTANEFYLRAARFYQNAELYLPESDARCFPLSTRRSTCIKERGNWSDRHLNSWKYPTKESNYQAIFRNRGELLTNDSPPYILSAAPTRRLPAPALEPDHGPPGE